MKSFKDNKDREWEVSVNIAMVKRVRDLLKVNILDIEDGKLFKRFGEDPVLLVDVLYVLCRDRAEDRKIIDEDFGRAMSGDAISRAFDALVEEIIDFFPDSRRRAILRQLMEKGRVLEKMAIDQAEKKVEGLDLNGLLAKLSSNSATSSPESSGSTPPTLPSES